MNGDTLDLILKNYTLSHLRTESLASKPASFYFPLMIPEALELEACQRQGSSRGCLFHDLCPNNGAGCLSDTSFYEYTLLCIPLSE